MTSSTFDPTDPRSLARRAETYALAFAEAGAALAAQERLATELRNRGTGTIATAAVTMSIFGRPAAGGMYAGAALYVAIAAFAAACFCVLGVLWPRRLSSVTDAQKLIPMYAEPHHVPVALVHRALALHHAEDLERNRAALARMTRLSRASLLLLAVEVIASVVNAILTL